jgi:hypothetical protein
MKKFGEPSFIKSKFRQVSGFESFRAEISFLIHHRNCSIPWVGDCIVCGNTQFQDGKCFVDYPTVTNGSDIAINVSCRPFKLTIVTPNEFDHLQPIQFMWDDGQEVDGKSSKVSH